MLLIKCPWCGDRAQTDFTYKGDAAVERPADPAAVSDQDWFEHIYLRDNPKGPHLELWQHANGCRAFFKVLRNVVTHDILATGRLDEDLTADGELTAGGEKPS